MSHTNTVYTGDNLYIMHGMNSDSVDLIYTDPPFSSKRIYSAPIGSKAAGAAFKDIWTWNDVDASYMELAAKNYPHIAQYIGAVQGIHSKAMASYLSFMFQRVIQMHRVLKPTGSLYMHIDPTASHYLKIICDMIFGKENFRNEIIWSYQGTGEPKRHYKRKHDVILFYAKTSKAFFSDTGSSEEVGEFSKSKYTKSDKKGRYKEIRHRDGKVYKQYQRDRQRMRDVWEIPIINAMAKERTGYPTQKPLALLRRIVEASSSEGDIVLDPFCGCATAMVAAQQLQRNWIGIDIESNAKDLVMERLADDAGLFKKFVHLQKPPVRTDVKTVNLKLNKAAIKEQLHKEQNGTCNGCKDEIPLKLMDIDHIIPSSKGGQDVMENYQLLCRDCNTRKSDKPMEYLLHRLRQLERASLLTSF